MDKNLVLADYRKWLLAVANRLVATSKGGRGEDYEGRVQDLAQEGYIAMWRALDSFDPERGAMASWLVKAAELRMNDVVRRGSVFGRPEQRGTVRIEDRAEINGLETVDQDELERRIGVWLNEGIALAYHRGQVQRAIGRLTRDEQRYVVMRFWEGKSNPEIDPHVQGNVSWLWKTARGKLREELRHLAP